MTSNAAALNAQAVELAEAGKLSDALPLFRKAIKKNPNSSEYLNNLGVALMRMDELDEALEAFKEALEIQPDYQDAKQNMRELKEYLKKRGSSKSSSKKRKQHSDEQKALEESKETKKKKSKKPDKEKSEQSQSQGQGHPHPVTGVKRRLNTNSNKRFTRIPIEEFYHSSNSHYRDGKSPMIITGAMKDWNIQALWSLDYFKTKFGQVTADFYPHNMDKADIHPFLTPLNRAIEELHQPTSAFPSNSEHPGTYIQWNIHWLDWKNLTQGFGTIPYQFIRDDFWLEECLRSEFIRDQYVKRTHWKMILIANKGAGMFNHQDVLRTASWQAQLIGAKRWHICAPDQSQYLYGAGKVDLFDPDYEQFPNYRYAKCFEDVVKAGEMIYYPRDYWHQTENLETPSVSVSASILDENNHNEIWEELNAECERQKYKWQFPEELCQDLKEKCRPLWKRRLERQNNEECSINHYEEL